MLLLFRLGEMLIVVSIQMFAALAMTRTAAILLLLAAFSLFWFYHENGDNYHSYPFVCSPAGLNSLFKSLHSGRDDL
jgi:low temperature requirement protein LtrA